MTTPVRLWLPLSAALAAGLWLVAAMQALPWAEWPGLPMRPEAMSLDQILLGFGLMPRGVVALVVGGLLVHDALGPEPREAATPTTSATPTEAAAEPPAPQPVVEGDLLLPEPTPTKTPEPPPPPPVDTVVTTAVANLPNRTADGPFAGSMRTLVSGAPDFVVLNEVGEHKAFGRPDNEIVLLTADGADGPYVGSKDFLAHLIWDTALHQRSSR